MLGFTRKNLFKIGEKLFIGVNNGEKFANLCEENHITQRIGVFALGEYVKSKNN